MALLLLLYDWQRPWGTMSRALSENTAANHLILISLCSRETADTRGWEPAAGRSREVDPGGVRPTEISCVSALSIQMSHTHLHTHTNTHLDTVKVTSPEPFPYCNMVRREIPDHLLMDGLERCV